MEQEVVQLIARDRLEIPLSSLYQKVKKIKGKDAKDLAERLGGARFVGSRTYAFVENEDKERARGLKEAVAEFATEFPKYGQILLGKVAEKRTLAEQHLYFGVNASCRLTTDDYVGVLQTLGLSESAARSIYPDLLNVSRKLAKAREEERSIIIGKYLTDTVKEE